MATVNTKWYLSSVGWNAVTAWSTPRTPAAGALVRQAAAPTAGNERVFVCIVSGAVGASEPVWVVSKGAKTTDNAATWMECTGQPGVNGDTVNTPTWSQNKNIGVALGLIIFDSVTNSLQIVTTAGTEGGGSQPSFSATAGVTTADNTVTWTSLGLASAFAGWSAPHARLRNSIAWGANGDTHYGASVHSATEAANINFATGSLIAPTQIISVNASGNVPPQGSDYLAGATEATTGATTISYNNYYKVIGFTFSAGSNHLVVGSTNNKQAFQHCKFIISTRNNAADIFEALTSIGGALLLDDVSFKFTNASNSIKVSGAASAGSLLEIRNSPSFIDGTGQTPTTLFQSTAQYIVNMILHGVDLSPVTTLFSNGLTFALVMSNCKINAALALGLQSSVASSLAMINCDSGATGYRNEFHNTFGDLTTETTITLSTSSGGASDGVQKYSWKAVTNANTSPVNPFILPVIAYDNTATGGAVTLGVEVISSGTLNNNDVWLETEALTTAGSTLSTFTQNGLANPLSAVTAQPLSTATWDSSPATPVKQRLANTVTPQVGGWIYGLVMIGKPTTTVYINPSLT